MSQVLKVMGHFDADNETRLAQAIQRVYLANFEFVREGSHLTQWVSALAFLSSAEGEGVAISTMFIPVGCISEVLGVLEKYAPEINELTKKYWNGEG